MKVVFREYDPSSAYVRPPFPLPRFCGDWSTLLLARYLSINRTKCG